VTIPIRAGSQDRAADETQNQHHGHSGPEIAKHVRDSTKHVLTLSAPALAQLPRPAERGIIGGMDVLSSRVLLRPVDLRRSRRFYRDVLGLAVYREFGDPADPSVVFFVGGGFLEVSGSGANAIGPPNLSLWLQVRDVTSEHQRLAALEVEIVRLPEREPWGLIEMWVADPDGTRIVLVEVPEQHPLRRDSRTPSSGAGT
jgi:catechol 2,3-dioxygenase-like lactoylglutathione lyase family enzyme